MIGAVPPRSHSPSSWVATRSSTASPPPSAGPTVAAGRSSSVVTRASARPPSSAASSTAPTDRQVLVGHCVGEVRHEPALPAVRRDGRRARRQGPRPRRRARRRPPGAGAPRAPGRRRESAATPCAPTSSRRCTAPSPTSAPWAGARRRRGRALGRRVDPRAAHPAVHPRLAPTASGCSPRGAATTSTAATPWRGRSTVWSRLPALTRIELGPLPDADLRSIVRRVGTDLSPDVVDEVARRAEGNAFFAEELAAAAADPGEPTPATSPGSCSPASTSSTTAPSAWCASPRSSAVGCRTTLLERVAGVDAVTLRTALRAAVEHHVLEPCGERRLRVPARAARRGRDRRPAARRAAPAAPGLRRGAARGPRPRHDRRPRAARPRLRRPSRGPRRVGAGRRRRPRMGGPAEALAHYETALTLAEADRAPAHDLTLRAASRGQRQRAHVRGDGVAAGPARHRRAHRPRARRADLGHWPSRPGSPRSSVDRLVPHRARALAPARRRRPGGAAGLPARPPCRGADGRRPRPPRRSASPTRPWPWPSSTTSPSTAPTSRRARPAQREQPATRGSRSGGSRAPSPPGPANPTSPCCARCTSSRRCTTARPTTWRPSRRSSAPLAEARRAGLEWSVYGVDARAMAVTTAYEMGEWDHALEVADHTADVGIPSSAAASIDASRSAGARRSWPGVGRRAPLGHPPVVGRGGTHRRAERRHGDRRARPRRRRRRDARPAHRGGRLPARAVG